jgi:hypothetical protein
MPKIVSYLTGYSRNLQKCQGFPTHLRFNILAACPTPLIPNDADMAMYNKY